MDALSDGVSRFGSLTLSVLPWFVIGVVAAGVVQTFVPQRWAARVLGGRGGLAMAITAGAVMPGCSRTTMPLVLGLRGMEGARLGSLTALVFVAPLLSPITVALTWSLLGWRITVARVIASLAGAALIGTVVNRFEPWFESRWHRPIMGADPAFDRCCDRDGLDTVQAPRDTPTWQRLAANVVRTMRRVLPYFVAGIALAAAVSTLLPEHAIPDALGGTNGLWTYLLAAVAGAPIYVCQGEEVPLTYALLASGIAHGPALTFLLGSVGMCLPTVVMSRAVLAPRVTYAYVGFWIVFAIAAGATFEAVAG